MLEGLSKITYVKHLAQYLVSKQLFSVSAFILLKKILDSPY